MPNHGGLKGQAEPPWSCVCVFVSLQRKQQQRRHSTVAKDQTGESKTRPTTQRMNALKAGRFFQRARPLFTQSIHVRRRFLYKSLAPGGFFAYNPDTVCIQLRQVHKTAVNNRPTKDELLAEARGFLERCKIRIKYPLMRQMRPWTLNDITAMFSWLFLGQSLWLLVGTTSFFSLVLWLGSNSRQFQGNDIYGSCDISFITFLLF